MALPNPKRAAATGGRCVAGVDLDWATAPHFFLAGTVRIIEYVLGPLPSYLANTTAAEPGQEFGWCRRVPGRELLV